MLDRPLLLFGGKGGVGKTTLASAFAYRSASRGDETLLVSTDPAHSIADLFGEEVGSEPTRIGNRLWALEIDPEKEADAYIDGVKEQIAQSTAPRLLEEVERQIDIARVSPGAEEAALFERFTRILQEEGSRYRRVIFDTAPTGHTLRLISLPELMTTWMSGLVERRRKLGVLNRMWRNVAGSAAADRQVEDPVLKALSARKRRFQQARRRLTNAKHTAFIFVLIPERLPILETAKALRVLEKYRIPVAGVIVNRVLPSGSGDPFFERRRAREAEYLDDIGRRFGNRVLWQLPLLDEDVVGVSGLETLLGHIPTDQP